MRVMVLIKANKNTEAGILPSQELLTQMGKYNEELVRVSCLRRRIAPKFKRGAHQVQWQQEICDGRAVSLKRRS